MRHVFTIIAIAFLVIGKVSAMIKTEMIDYESNGTLMQSYLAYDDANTSARPGILIVPDWMGLGPYAKQKAEQLAKEGYVAMAIDVYGKGVRPKDTTEASKFVAKFQADRKTLRERTKAAYDALVARKEVTPNKILIMGYCFGGMTALELARSGTNLVGTVSFHGLLSTPHPEDAKNIKGSVLVLHGADDPMVPPSEVDAFKKSMKEAGVDLTFISYPGAVHAFTNPAAGHDKSTGIAYDEKADKESWSAFEAFLKKVFH